MNRITHQEGTNRPIPSLQPHGVGRLKFLVVVLIALAAVYGRVVRFDFVTYDDYDLIYNNTGYLSKLSNVFDTFRTQGMSATHPQSIYYRPIQVITHILDYQVWGLNAAGFHTTGLLLHAIVAAFVFWLVIRLTKEEWAALAVSLIFALHPIQTEAVGWIAGRVDVLLGLFILMTLYFYVCAHDVKSTRLANIILMHVAFAFALFSKEPAVLALVLLPLYDLCFDKINLRGLFTWRYALNFLFMGIMIVAYIAVRIQIFGEAIGAEKAYASAPLSERLRMAPDLFAEHLQLMLAPFRLSIAHPIEGIAWFQAPWSVLAWIVPVVLAVLVWWAWRNDRLLCFGLCWMIVTLLPMLNVMPIAIPVMEHRLYVPMVGLAIVLYRLIFLATDRLQLRPQKIALGVTGILIIVLTVLTVDRLSVWKNSETLWRDTIEKVPTYSRSYFNLAGWYFERREYTKTTELLEKFVALVPDDYFAHSKLRQSYYLAGRYGDAARICRKMIALSPTNFNRYAEAAELYMQLQQPDSAIAIYTVGIERNPNSYQLCDLLGRVYVRTKREAEAERWFRRAVEINPQFPQAHFDLGVLYASKERNADALAQIEEGAQYGSPEKDVAQLLYHLYVDAGRMAQADSVRRRYNF